MIEIRKCGFSDVENSPDFPRLLEQYGDESAITDMPTPSAKLELYRQLDASGIFHTFAAYSGEHLIGFITVLMPVLAHYDAICAVSESYFVSPNFRSTGAGDKLREAAEHFAEKHGAVGLLITAPIGSRLAMVMAHKDSYTETSRVFFRSFRK